MDSFETVVASLLRRIGYWTITSYKVDLTPADKRLIGRHSSPRWEIDLVAYRGGDNTLKVIECKSLLDSPGVEVRAFDGSNPAAESRYKLFREPQLREVVLARLVDQLTESRHCAPKPIVSLCLAAGRISGDSTWLAEHFAGHGWELLGPDWVRGELESLRDSKYENSIEAVVTKILLRVPKRTGSRTK